MYKRNYYFCVDDLYPEMKRGATYNSSVIPACLGTQVYKFEDLFEDLSEKDTGYVEVTIPTDGKIVSTSGNEIFVDRFSFVNRSKFSGSMIQWLIESGVRVDAGPYRSSIVDWAIANDSISTLIYLADKCECIRDVMNSYMGTFVIKRNYTPVIMSLVEKGYNIHKNDDSLFLYAASSKNHELSRFLLEHGANISMQVIRMYKANEGAYPDMEMLLEEYKDRIISI